MRVAVVALVGALVGACAHIGSRPEAQILTAERRNETVDGDAAAGGAVYATQCAACHGANGEGGFGPNLIDSSVAQDYPRTVEQVEQGQGAMPAFEGVLTDPQIRDVAAYVHEIIAVNPTQPSLPDVGTLPTTVGSVSALGIPANVNPANGAQTYKDNCSSCHGDRGEGTTVGPPLTRPISVDDVITLILAGRPGMPSYKLLLPTAKLEELAAYVAKTFMEPALLNGSTTGSSGSGASAQEATGSTEG
jgi:mono/diheme cytochrome c family protein